MVAEGVTSGGVRSKEHDYRTLILSPDDEQVVGVAAILVGDRHVAPSEGVLRSLAHHLIRKDVNDTEVVPEAAGAPQMPI